MEIQGLKRGLNDGVRTVDSGQKTRIASFNLQRTSKTVFSIAS